MKQPLRNLTTPAASINSAFSHLGLYVTIDRLRFSNANDISQLDHQHNVTQHTIGAPTLLATLCCSV